jgi:hypothetical protein
VWVTVVCRPAVSVAVTVKVRLPTVAVSTVDGPSQLTTAKSGPVHSNSGVTASPWTNVAPSAGVVTAMVGVVVTSHSSGASPTRTARSS